jgi:hypothetical protein
MIIIIEEGGRFIVANVTIGAKISEHETREEAEQARKKIVS